LDVGGSPAEVLDEPASALLVSLHAAHHGPVWGSALQDLRRATAQLHRDCWVDAARLATRLEATEAMGTGLGLTAEGQEIAADLGIPTSPSFALRLLWGGAPWGSTFIEALVRQPGLRGRLTLLARLVWPGADAMRLTSPLARRGPAGLAAAYAVRPLKLLRRAPTAIRRWRALRRSG
jgi:hypothetical protein